MRKKIFTFLLALAASVGMSWATENSIVINGTPQVGDNSISLTYYFDPANVPGLDQGFAPTLKVKRVEDGIFDEEWLNSYDISSGTKNITLDNLGSFQAGKSYDVCFAYNNGGWVDEVFQSFSFPATPAPVTAARFLYNYDCQRSPAYPQQGSPCTLRGFSNPYVGYNGIGRDLNTPFGPWKLEFVAYYTPSNDYGCQSVVSQAVNQYYSSLSSQEKEAKRLEVPIFRLWQYNIVAGEYQHAAYGIVCAYAAEGNAEDHGALFISSTNNGCFLAGKPHDAQISLSCENDLTTGMNNLVTAASATDPDYDAYMPVILSIDAIGTVELTQHCKDFIEGSSSAYNALTDAQKGQVTNYSTLTDAEAQWAALVAEAKPYADAVVDLINAIPNPVVYTQQCKDAIDAAQNAYNALTDGQKMFVSNYETLKNAPFDLINAAPYVHILFKANDQERKVENVTFPKEFTKAEMETMLKELYGVEGDYDMYAYSYADAVNISYEKWTIYPFTGTVNVNGSLSKYDPETGDFDDIRISLEITLELPPYESEQDPTAVENVQTNQVQATKFFRDGQLLIEKNGKIYTLQGAEVK